MSFVNGARWLSGAFTGVLNWTPTANRTITIPDASGIIQLDASSTTVYRSVISVTTSKTLALSDLGTYQYCTNTSAITVSIPLSGAVAFPVGAEIEIKKGGSGALSVGLISGVTLLGDGGATLTAPFSITKGATIKQVTNNTWVLEGS